MIACDFKTCPENNECVLQDSPSGASCVCKNGFSKLPNDSCIGEFVCLFVCTGRCLIEYNLSADINECSLGRGPPPRGHNCPQNSDCINSEGSFSCQCHPGYLLDARNIECLGVYLLLLLLFLLFPPPPSSSSSLSNLSIPLPPSFSPHCLIPLPPSPRH